MLIKIVNAIFAVIAGVAGAVILFWALNKFAEAFRTKTQERIKPYLFILPAFAAIGLYLIYPAVQTLIYSFANARSTAFVGFANYRELLQSSSFQNTLINTLLWIIVVPIATIIVGLVVASIADRMSPRGEKSAKTLIFLPMAISAVGAGTIWKFVYASNPPGQDQVGLLNAIVVRLGGDPVSWLQLSDGRVNSFFLMAILVWVQAGFAMVLLSAAIKGVPVDTLEAARIDGAREGRVFFSIVLPQIRGTVITVFITVLIGVMKTFDIVYVMTNGNFNTNVVAVDFYNQLFTNGNTGYAAAIVVMLLVAIIPIMIYQVRQFRVQEAQ